MTQDAWIEIPRHRYIEVWNLFEEAFEFRPSVRPEDWPTYKEPSPSVTYNVADLLRELDPWRDPRATPYNQGLLMALLECVPEGEPILALDWQHRSYEFYPHRFHGAENPANWRIPALPSGEYHIFSSPPITGSDPSGTHGKGRSACLGPSSLPSTYDSHHSAETGSFADEVQ